MQESMWREKTKLKRQLNKKKTGCIKNGDKQKKKYQWELPVSV